MARVDQGQCFDFRLRTSDTLLLVDLKMTSKIVLYFSGLIISFCNACPALLCCWFDQKRVYYMEPSILVLANFMIDGYQLKTFYVEIQRSICKSCWNRIILYPLKVEFSSLIIAVNLIETLFCFTSPLENELHFLIWSNLSATLLVLYADNSTSLIYQCYNTREDGTCFPEERFGFVSQASFKIYFDFIMSMQFERVPINTTLYKLNLLHPVAQSTSGQYCLILLR